MTASAIASLPTEQAQPLRVIGYTTPPKVTGRQPAACVARMGGQLPDPGCTPGSVGSTDQAQVCASGKPSFSDAHRPAEAATAGPKTAAMRAYHVPATDRPRTEYDHLVPLALGGSNDVSNLWPQVSDLSIADSYNSKDAVELHLWHAVCRDHAVKLTDAQAAVARDWTGAEKFLGLSPA